VGEEAEGYRLSLSLPLAKREVCCSLDYNGRGIIADKLELETEMTQDIIPCSRCGTNNLRGQRYCSGCNQRLHYSCPSCSEEVDNVLHNCPKCKVALSWPTVGQVDPRLIKPVRTPAMRQAPLPGQRTLPVRPPLSTVPRPRQSSPSQADEPAMEPEGVERQRPAVAKGRALIMIAGLGVLAIGLLVVLVVLAMTLMNGS
jgi:hypothetical protein